MNGLSRPNWTKKTKIDRIGPKGDEWTKRTKVSRIYSIYLDILIILLVFVNQQLIIEIAKHKSYNTKKCEPNEFL